MKKTPEEELLNTKLIDNIDIHNFLRSKAINIHELSSSSLITVKIWAKLMPHSSDSVPGIEVALEDHEIGNCLFRFSVP